MSAPIVAVSAWQWTCPECHDTGLARSIPGATEQLDEHRDDYHAPVDLDALDAELDADDDAELLTFDGSVIR